MPSNERLSRLYRKTLVYALNSIGANDLNAKVRNCSSHLSPNSKLHVL